MPGNEEDLLTYPSGGTPDPYQPTQPYGQQPYDPYAVEPSSGQPHGAQPAGGPPHAPLSGGAPYEPPVPGQPYGAPSPGQPYGPPSGASPYGPPASGQAPYGPPVSGQPFGQPGYGPEAYQQPYGQPGYGQPGYGQPYPPMMAPTNTMAILALVFAFVFPPAGIVLGHLARKQIRQTGEQGQGLATAGLWVGYLHVAFWLLICVFYAVALIAFGTGSGTST